MEFRQELHVENKYFMNLNAFISTQKKALRSTGKLLSHTVYLISVCFTAIQQFTDTLYSLEKSEILLKRLWRRRTRYRQYSKRWIRIDRRCNFLIEQITIKLVKQNQYNPLWHVQLWWKFLAKLP